MNLTKEQREALKVGDVVGICDGFGRFRVVNVSRRTHKQLVAGGARFSVETGREIGPLSRYHRSYLYTVEYANGRIQMARLHEKRVALRSFVREALMDKSLSHEKVERIAAIINEPEVKP